jgi:hypothetical protein
VNEKCREISQKVPQFVAGELSAEDASQLRLHLEACKSCMAVAKHYRTMLSNGKSFEPDILYGAAWNRIARGLEGREPSRKEDIGFWAAHKKAILLASACAIILLIAYIVPKPAGIQPAMSISEMEEILRSVGDLDGGEERALHYGTRDPHRLMGSTESERLHRIPGVGRTDDRTYSIEPF